MALGDRQGETGGQESDLCPAVEAIADIGGRWRLQILLDLQDREKRFNELKRSTGASPSTLSRVLDTLTAYELVERRTQAEPYAVYYRLTERGAALEPVFHSLQTWTDNWSDTL